MSHFTVYYDGNLIHATDVWNKESSAEVIKYLNALPNLDTDKLEVKVDGVFSFHATNSSKHTVALSKP